VPERTGSLPALLASLACLAGAVACSNPDAVLGVVKEPMSQKVSLSRDVQPILSTSCATAFCHGSPLAAPMSLQSSDSFSSLVGVPSCEAPSLKRVEPGNSAASYLTAKLEGTQSTILNAGGCVTCDYTVATESACGQRMPRDAPSPLPDSEIQLIRDWIDQGAADN